MGSPIDTQGLSRRFGKTDAVHDLTLTVPEGSVFALIGPNGAGKTTTIKLLLNLLRPTAGGARVLGRDVRHLGVAELGRIGYVSENQKLPEWMTTDQLLDYCRGLYPASDGALTFSDLLFPAKMAGSDAPAWSRDTSWFDHVDLVIVARTPSGSVVRTLEFPQFQIRAASH